MTHPPRLPFWPAAAFVLVWCSGYIAGPASVAAAAPFTVLTLRFAVAAVLGAALAVMLRRPWRMPRETLLRIVGVGLVMNALVFGLMYVAFDLGLGATLGALLHSLSPVLTVVLAAVLLGEAVSLLQAVGFVVGVVGVLVVLAPDVEAAGGGLSVVCAALSVLCLSLGTLGQRWVGSRGAAPDPLWSATVQFAVSVPPVLVLALTVEGPDRVIHPVAAAVSIGFLAVVNSIAGLLLLALLVRRGGAGAAGSLFFLAPPVTAVLAWLVLGEVLVLREWLGLLIAVVGVAAATRARAPTADPSLRHTS